MWSGVAVYYSIHKHFFFLCCCFLGIGPWGPQPLPVLVRNDLSDLGVSKNRGPGYSTLNSRILIIRTPNKVPHIFGNPHFLSPESLVAGAS